jgi:hypothetical protein
VRLQAWTCQILIHRHTPNAGRRSDCPAHLLLRTAPTIWGCPGWQKRSGTQVAVLMNSAIDNRTARLTLPGARRHQERYAVRQQGERHYSVMEMRRETVSGARSGSDDRNFMTEALPLDCDQLNANHWASLPPGYRYGVRSHRAGGFPPFSATHLRESNRAQAAMQSSNPNMPP